MIIEARFHVSQAGVVTATIGGVPFYRTRKCSRCGALIYLPQTIRKGNSWDRHDARCRVATPHERREYLRTRRWPERPGRRR